MPADEDLGVLLIHSIQHPCLGAVALLAAHDLPWWETIPCQALPRLRLGDLHIMQAQGAPVHHHVEPSSAAGGAGALHRGTITRQAAEVLGHRREGVQGEPPGEQRFEQRRTPL